VPIEQVAVCIRGFNDSFGALQSQNNGDVKFESGPIRNAETIAVALYHLLLGILPD